VFRSPPLTGDADRVSDTAKPLHPTARCRRAAAHAWFQVSDCRHSRVVCRGAALATGFIENLGKRSRRWRERPLGRRERESGSTSRLPGVALRGYAAAL